MVTFLLCGLWHGAGWTFVIWGMYWGLLLAAYLLGRRGLKKPFGALSVKPEGVWFWIKIVLFFHLTCFGWIFFRSGSLSQAIRMLSSLFLNFKTVNYADLIAYGPPILFYTGLLLILEAFQFIKKDQMAVYKANPLLKAAVYIICYYLMVLHGGASIGKEFIYFQF